MATKISKDKAEPKSKPKAKAAAKPEPKPAAKPAAKAITKAAAKPAAKAKSAVPMTKLKEMAKELDLKGAAKMAKPELIHAIQVAEGHAACFARIPDCGQMDCLFRPDCLPEMGVHS